LLIAVVGRTALAPRRWWLIALLVIGPIPVIELLVRMRG